MNNTNASISDINIPVTDTNISPQSVSNHAADTNIIPRTICPVTEFVTLLKPNGGEVIPSGSNYLIEWNPTPLVYCFSLYYSMNNGTTWKPINSYQSATGTSYNWYVPSPLNNKKNDLPPFFRTLN